MQDLVALLLAAGEAHVDAAAQHVLLDAESGRDLAHALEKLWRRKLRLSAFLALRVERRAQERHGGDAGNLQRILKGEKKTPRGALVRIQREDIRAVEQHLALGDGVTRLAGEDISERRLAGPVRTHDGVHGTWLDRQIEPVENPLAVHLDVEILDFEERHARCRSLGHPTLPSRLIEISFCASTANSIGSCWSTSLTKPLTTSATASSADMPRCRQ